MTALKNGHRANGTPAVPRSTYDQRYADAIAREAQLKGELDATQRKRAEILNRPAHALHDHREAAAAALLSGREPASVAVADEGHEREVAALTERLAVLRIACEQQGRIRAELRAARSREVCRSSAIADEYGKLWGAVLEAEIAVCEARRRAIEFADRLRDADLAVDSYLRPIGRGPLGDLRDSASRIRMFVEESYEFGFIDDAKYNAIVPVGQRRRYARRGA